MTTHLAAKPAGTPTWIDVASPDAAAARAFYQAVFGWEYDIGPAEYGGYTTARLGTRTVAGLLGDAPEPAPPAWNLYFATHDIDADVARAIALGATVIAPAVVVGDFGSMAVCQDPTGAVFCLWQAGSHIGAQVTDEPGAAGWYELYSTNAQQARDFYTALLGASANPMPGGMEYYVLNHGDTPICGIMQIDPAWGDFHPHWITYFIVVNADETVATVKAHGGKIMGPIEDSPFGRIAALADSGGANFKIVEPPAR